MSRVLLPLALLLALALAACAGGEQESSAASPPTVGATVLVTVATHGGLCPNGECRSTTEVWSDGRVVRGERTVSAAPALIEAVRVEIARADFRRIAGRPFAGQCPTAYDGQETIYTFHLAAGDQVIASCTVAIDLNDPLFRAVDALTALAQG
jgi:hypothetical protein